MRLQNHKERRETLRIMQLRTAPQFEELIKLLTRGKTAWSVTDWFMQHEDRGELSGCSFETARKAITALRLRVREEAERIPPRPEVSQVFDRVVTALVKGSNSPAVFTKMAEIVNEEVEKMQAAKILKYAAILQLERIDELRELEKKSKLQMPWGNKSMQVLTEIASAIHDVEMGEIKKLTVSWGGTITATGMTSNLSPEVQKVAELPEAEKNLWRDCAAKVIDLIEQEGKRGSSSPVQPSH
jgi:hypothetical protein